MSTTNACENLYDDANPMPDVAKQSHILPRER